MIEKRYEYFGPKGKVWTKWFTTSLNDSDLEMLQKNDKWQVKNKLRNEYRIAQ